jgi:hypothetical protein
MTKRRRGRPLKPERTLWGDVAWLEEMMEREQTAMRSAGHKPTKLLSRAADLLGIPERTAKRRMQEARLLTSTDWSKTPLGAWLREQQRREQSEKTTRSDLLALDSCSAE